MIQEIVVSSDEVDAWKEHPVTKAVFDMLERRMYELQAEWANGKFLSENPSVTQLQNAKAVGALEVYRELYTLNEEDINE